MRHRAVTLSVLASAVTLAACAEVPAPQVLPPPPPQPAPTAASVPAPEPPSPPPARWARVFRRGCNGSITPPVPSPDGASVASCGTRFGAERGRFLGAAPFGVLALLPGDRAIIDEYGDGGLALTTPDVAEPVRDAGGRPEAIVVAPDGSRVVSLERMRKTDERHVVVRALPSLARVRDVSLGKGPGGTALGILADGREVMFGSYPCVEVNVACPNDPNDLSCRMPKCEGRGLFVIDRGAVSPLVPGLREGTIGARGDLAVVVREDGSAAEIALPDGHTIAQLPPVGDEDIDAVAVSAAGDRVAIATSDKLAIFARSGAQFVEVLAAPHPNVRTMRFAADGRTLFTGDDLTAYREGAEPREVKAPAYEPALPKGFVKLARKDNIWALPNEGERGVQEGEIAMFAHPKIGAEVVVSVIDADELDPGGDAETWAKRVAARIAPDTPLGTEKERKKAGFVAWGEPGARSLELHWTARGCEDIDSYERVSERDGALVRVHLQVYGELSAKRLAPWLGALFDEPLGKSPARAAVRERSPAKAKAAAAQRKAVKHKRRKRKAGGQE
ncbi:MAG: hypothetical protein QM820_05030 [Minicystis sp.]